MKPASPGYERAVGARFAHRAAIPSPLSSTSPQGATFGPHCRPIQRNDCQKHAVPTEFSNNSRKTALSSISAIYSVRHTHKFRKWTGTPLVGTFPSTCLSCCPTSERRVISPRSVNTTRPGLSLSQCGRWILSRDAFQDPLSGNPKCKVQEQPNPSGSYGCRQPVCVLCLGKPIQKGVLA